MKLEPDNYINKYEALSVKYIPGHNPDLVIYEAEVCCASRARSRTGGDAHARTSSLSASKPRTQPTVMPPAPQAEKERIDLTKIASGKNTPDIEDIQGLLTEKGFQLKPEAPVGCADKVADCPSWASSGECEANPAFMDVSCPKSCGYAPRCVWPASPLELLVESRAQCTTRAPRTVLARGDEHHPRWQEVRPEGRDVSCPLAQRGCATARCRHVMNPV